ncbi:hypothetical protein F511_12011 [Dorcoceras hygrometricum]|uniref:Uncharacterized protein n=1 Tax=Dorcoceras hygrometricum TaxID=472368 RepID=A0A2Z7AIG4_9LAMI|nr:hypothetical protein F511_12011 [Dorcoceras hygrometricum]
MAVGRRRVRRRPSPVCMSSCGTCALPAHGRRSLAVAQRMVARSVESWCMLEMHGGRWNGAICCAVVAGRCKRRCAICRAAVRVDRHHARGLVARAFLWRRPSSGDVSGSISMANSF